MRKAARRGNTQPIEVLGVDPQGRYLAAGLQNGQIEIWDVRGLVFRGAFSGHAGMVRMVRFSPDGSALASYGRDAKLSVWNFVKYREGIEEQLRYELEKDLSLSLSGISDFRFLEAGKIIAGTAGGKVLELDIERAKMQKEAVLDKEMENGKQNGDT